MNTILLPVSAVNTSALINAPQILPPNLQGIYNLIEALAHRLGFCFARTRWFAEKFQVSTAYINRLLRRLVTLGRLRIETIPDSHDRRFYPVPMPAVSSCRKSSPSVTKEFPKTRDTSYRQDSKERKSNNSAVVSTISVPAPVPDTVPVDTAVVSLLLEKGVEEKTALQLAKDNPEECRKQTRNPWVIRVGTAGALIAAIRRCLPFKGDNPPSGTESPVSVSPESMPSSFAGYPNAASEWERGVRRHLGGVSRERYANLRERAEGELRRLGRTPSPGTLCEYMATAHRFDQKDEAAAPA